MCLFLLYSVTVTPLNPVSVVTYHCHLSMFYVFTNLTLLFSLFLMFYVLHPRAVVWSILLVHGFLYLCVIL